MCFQKLKAHEAIFGVPRSLDQPEKALFNWHSNGLEGCAELLPHFATFSFYYIIQALKRKIRQAFKGIKIWVNLMRPLQIHDDLNDALY